MLVTLTFVLTDKQVEGLHYACDDLLAVYGDDDETHSDEEIALIRHAVDALLVVKATIERK